MRYNVKRRFILHLVFWRLLLRMCAASGISATLILWSVTCVAVEEMLKMGITPSVLKSANFPGGNEYNQQLIDHYEKTGF